MGRIEIDENRCKGCGLCTTACHLKLISLSTEINALGFTPAITTNPERCTGCSLCAELCPDVAIAVFKDSKQTK